MSFQWTWADELNDWVFRVATWVCFSLNTEPVKLRKFFQVVDCYVHYFCLDQYSNLTWENFFLIASWFRDSVIIAWSIMTNICISLYRSCLKRWFYVRVFIFFLNTTYYFMNWLLGSCVADSQMPIRRTLATLSLNFTAFFVTQCWVLPSYHRFWCFKFSIFCLETLHTFYLAIYCMLLLSKSNYECLLQCLCFMWLTNRILQHLLHLLLVSSIKPWVLLSSNQVQNWNNGDFRISYSDCCGFGGSPV